jgi:anti-sigma B factor antagonist
MFSTELSERSYDGHAVVALRGDLDVVDAAAVAAALTAVAVREPKIIVDLAGLEFIDSSGVAALVRGRRQARQAGGSLTLAAPQQDVMRVLAVTRLVDAFSVYATAEEAASGAGSLVKVAAPEPRRTRQAARASAPRRDRDHAAGRRGPADSDVHALHAPLRE